MTKDQLSPPRKHFLCVGDPAPWFTCELGNNNNFRFDTIAGRYVMIGFLGSKGDSDSQKVISFIKSHRGRFDDKSLTFFGVLTNEKDLKGSRKAKANPGIYYIQDSNLDISRIYGAVKPDGDFRKVIYILDPALRIMTVIPLSSPAFNERSLNVAIRNIPATEPGTLARQQAPVLVLPRVFEPKLCKELIDYYNKSGGNDSGFMKDIDGKTVGVIDHSFKSRRDCRIKDESLQKACMMRIHKRLIPEVKKVFQFPASQVERYIIACYDAEDGGFFSAHRDNTTKATSHRRFAVSLFLNSDYEGGYLKFPEYGQNLYSAPRGGAVIFSCSLLHEATKVTKGRRYMFLPFIHDDAGQEIRKNTAQFLDSKIIKKDSGSDLKKQTGSDKKNNTEEELN